MNIYIFDCFTGKHIETSVAGESPLEPGTFLIPVNATSAPLPELKTNEAAIINAARDGWDVIVDYVGTDYWLTDGSYHTIMELGVIPPIDALYVAPFIVENAKQAAITRIKSECDAHIVGGIDVGEFNYPTTRYDQADISFLFARSQALGVGGEPYKFMCVDAQGIWARRDHTASQIQSLGLAVSQHVIDAKDKFDIKLAAIEAIAELPSPTQADFDAIVW